MKKKSKTATSRKNTEKKRNDEKQKNQISFCQLIQFLPNSHAHTRTHRESEREEDIRTTKERRKKQTIIVRIACGIRFGA